MTFNYPIFISQSGMEFWVLNAGLFALWVGSQARRVTVAVGRTEVRVPARRPLPALPSLPPVPVEVAS
jgi:hypothetical protein